MSAKQASEFSWWIIILFLVICFFILNLSTIWAIILFLIIVNLLTSNRTTSGEEP